MIGKMKDNVTLVFGMVRYEMKNYLTRREVIIFVKGSRVTIYHIFILICLLIIVKN